MRKLSVFLMAMMLVAAMGCKKDDPDNGGGNGGNNIEIDGFYYSVSEDNVTKIYKGSHLLYTLPKASSVVVKGNSIYAAVREESAPYWKLSVWKDGNKLYDLPANDIFPSGWSGACGICVNGNDVIVTCTERISAEPIGAKAIGKVWRNSQLLYTLNLPDSARYTWPVKPCVVGEDIYVAGLYSIKNDLYGYRGAIWKNGELFFSTQGYYWDRMKGVGSYNGDLYYYGIEGSNGDGNYHGKIWKNGEVICDAQEKSWAEWGDISDVVIYNGDVYACGCIETKSSGGTYYHSDGGNEGTIGIVWKNGEIIYEITERNPFDNLYYPWYGSLSSINIIDGDVYVSGTAAGFATKIWKNGVEYQEIPEGIYGVGSSVYLLKNGMAHQDQF